MTKLSDTDVKIVVEQIERIAERRGYQRAIDALRDNERYGRWWVESFTQNVENAAAADYLESIYPEVTE